MTYLDLLPDELYRRIAKYMYAEPMGEIHTLLPLIEGVWPPLEMAADMQNCSDHIRSACINNSYRRHSKRHYRESDWYNLLIDLERPCGCYPSTDDFYPLHPTWLTRQCKVYDISASGCFWWSSCRVSVRLTYAGWCRLTHG